MKQRKIKNVVFGLLMLFTSFVLANNKYKVTVANNMLVFEKRQDYEKVIKDLNKTQKEEFVTFLLQSMQFSKLADFTTTALYSHANDGFIEYILNKDGYLQINNFIYKVDLTKGVVATMDVSNYSNLIKEMDAGEYNSPLIRTFATDEPVIQLTESNLFGVSSPPLGALFLSLLNGRECIPS